LKEGKELVIDDAAAAKGGNIEVLPVKKYLDKLIYINNYIRILE
jgi:hypothetical protein